MGNITIKLNLRQLKSHVMELKGQNRHGKMYCISYRG